MDDCVSRATMGRAAVEWKKLIFLPKGSGEKREFKFIHARRAYRAWYKLNIRNCRAKMNAMCVNSGSGRNRAIELIIYVFYIYRCVAIQRTKALDIDKVSAARGHKSIIVNCQWASFPVFRCFFLKFETLRGRLPLRQRERKRHRHRNPIIPQLCHFHSTHPCRTRKK